MTWAVQIAGMGKKINAYNILIGKSQARTPLGRPKRTQEVHIKTDCKEVKCEDMN
jgi:hypothetical protein